MKKIFSITLVSLLIISCSSTKNAVENIAEVRKKVDGKNYIIDVNFAKPLRARQISLSAMYSLEIRNDSAFAHLPYFGVAYMAPYGGGEGGIMFREPIKAYSIEPNKKNNAWNITFKVDTKDYNYQFYLDIFENGSSTISVSSYQRDQISFSGYLR